jgi:hypothetical protein
MNSHQPHLFPQWNGGMRHQLLFPQPAQQPSPSPGAVLFGLALGALVLYALFGGTQTNELERTCAACGRSGHDRRTCSHAGPRISFSRATPKSRRCRCCGRYRQGTERHHTQGRSSIWDYLDLCDDCHLACGHEGDFRNLAIKPQFCRVTGHDAFWRR